MQSLSGEEILAIKRLLRYSWQDVDFNYAQLTPEERALISPEVFASLRTWALTEIADLEPGDVVRAKVDLNIVDVVVFAGDLGTVIGAAYHDGDCPNPLIQWFRFDAPTGVALGPVSNTPARLLEVVRPRE